MALSYSEHRSSRHLVTTYRSRLVLDTAPARPSNAAGTARIPVRMFFNGPAQPNPGEFRRIEADLARFELISDPNDLVPADLVADPYVHLVPNPALAPVRLIGPASPSFYVAKGSLTFRPTSLAPMAVPTNASLRPASVRHTSLLARPITSLALLATR